MGGLSDKIQGLKFMKRASASSEKQDTPQHRQHATSQTASPAKETSPTAFNGIDEDGNDEHWVLPGATQTVQESQVDSSGQTGWHTWLGHVADESSPSNPTSARRSFGRWASKRQQSPPHDKQEGSEGVSCKSSTDEDSEENRVHQPDEGEDEGEVSRTYICSSKPIFFIQMPRTFVKPGKASERGKDMGEIRKTPTQKAKGTSTNKASPSSSSNAGPISAQAKRKQSILEGSSGSDAHAEARIDAAKRKRQDMGSKKKASKRK